MRVGSSSVMMAVLGCRFGVSEATLLLAVLRAEAVGSRAAGVSLAGCHQVSQVLIEVHTPCCRCVGRPWEVEHQ